LQGQEVTQLTAEPRNCNPEIDRQTDRQTDMSRVAAVFGSL